MPNGDRLYEGPERSGRGKQIKEGYSHDADRYANTPRPSEQPEGSSTSDETNSGSEE